MKSEFHEFFSLTGFKKNIDRKEEVRQQQKKEEEELAKTTGKPIQQKMTLAMRREIREREELEREREKLAQEQAQKNITQQPELTGDLFNILIFFNAFCVICDDRLFLVIENPNRSGPSDIDARSLDDALQQLQSAVGDTTVQFYYFV